MFRRRCKKFRRVAGGIHGLVRFTSNRCSDASCKSSDARPESSNRLQSTLCALMGCLRSCARCVSVGRGSLAFWPAAWGCSDSSDLIQVSTFFIAATLLCQVCSLLCPPVRPMARGPNIFYCRHSAMSGVLASLPSCPFDGLRCPTFFIAAAQLCQVCLLLCLPLHPLQHQKLHRTV